MLRIATLLAAIITLHHAGAANAGDACALALGSKLKINGLDSVLELVVEGLIEKDQFETIKEFEARKAAAEDFTDNKTFIVASDVDQKQASYDAEKEAWFLTSLFPSNGNLSFGTGALVHAGLINYFDEDRVEENEVGIAEDRVGEEDRVEEHVILKMNQFKLEFPYYILACS